MTHGNAHICASLPKHTVSLRVTWCSAHQAWTIESYVITDDGGDPTEIVPVRSLELGPFDMPADALALAVEVLASGHQKLTQRCHIDS